MFRQVLVPVEFSACGRLAARHACDMVRAIGGTVTLLHVLEPSAAERSESAEPEFREAQVEEAQELLRQLGLFARRLPTLLVVPGVNGVAAAILEMAAQTNTELIMLGLHRQEGPGQGTLGKVVIQVLLGAGVPVQVTPCHPEPGAPERGWRGVLTERQRTT